MYLIESTHTRRIDMTISSFRKHLLPSLLVASAAFVGSTSGAAAKDFTSSDPQDQARQLLAPTKAGQPVGPSGSSSAPSGVVKQVFEPQELARRLLVGADRSEKATIAAPTASTAPAARNGSSADSQALAQRMILGVRGVAKTPTVTAVTSVTAVAASRNVLE
jgi:hypothetical protein